MRITFLTTLAFASLTLVACSQKTKDAATTTGRDAGAAVQGAAADTAVNASEAAKKANNVAGTAARKADAAADAAAKTK